MLKGKAISILIAGLMLIGFATPIRANFLAVQTLPTYINSNDFYLSCTSSADSVSFSVSKHGASPVTFATVDLTVNPCVVQVTGSQINDETDYTFTVTDGVTSSSTSTIFDKSGPDPVSGFYIDGLSDGSRLHYHTPTNDDFSHVIIYRGDAPGFEADSSHEIATVASSRDSDMTYEDHSGPNKYYLIRAIDKAGNSSGLVGNGEEIITVTPTPGASVTTGRVTIFPKEQGSVLGEEASPSPSPSSTIKPGLVGKINDFASSTPQPFRWILTHKKISIGILLIAVAAYLFFRAKNKQK